MKRIPAVIAVVLFLASLSALAQQSSVANDAGSDDSDRGTITVRGCLRSERGNYILIANRTGEVYALQGVGNKLQSYLRKEVEVTGESKPGSVETGVRPAKAGSNPSDTVHAVDGVPLQVKNIDKDIRITATHCKPADQQ
ncbi:MAG TPA: hypothetical protein VN517_05985 [Terriglobales bacterium]|jgi:hypothetical protein|nr:hypothetical protein [Terriglobales bacterium]